MLTPHILKKQVDCYMQSLRFPKDAQVDLLAALDKMCQNGASFAAVSELVATYSADHQCHFTPILEKTREICTDLNIHTSTGELLLYLCLADTMRAHYRERGYGEELFWNALADLG